MLARLALSSALLVLASCSRPAQPAPAPTATAEGVPTDEGARVGAASAASVPADASAELACDGKHTPLSRVVAFDIGPPKKPEPLRGPCPLGSCYKGAHGAGTWYSAEVRVGLEPKSKGDRCAARAIDSLERSLRQCAIANGTVAATPAWLGRGSLVLEPRQAGTVVASNVETPKGVTKTFGACAAEAVAELQLVADPSTERLVASLVFESVATLIAE